MALGLSLLAMWFRQAILDRKAMVQLVQKHQPFEGRVEERLCHFSLATRSTRASNVKIDALTTGMPFLRGQANSRKVLAACRWRVWHNQVS